MGMKLTDIPPGRIRDAVEAQTRKAPHALALRDQVVALVLPWPPSLNNMYPTSRSGRRYLSDEGKAFKAAALAAISEQDARSFVGPVKIAMRLYRPQKRGDLSNRIKAVEDVLTAAGVWQDDGQVVELHATRFDDKENPRAEVEIRSAAFNV